MTARPDNDLQAKNSNHSRYKYLSVAGITLIAGGGLLLLAQVLHTTWLSLLALPVVGGILLVQGIHTRQMSWYISGSLAFFFGLGVVAGFGSILKLTTFQKVGVLLLAFSMGWASIALIAHFRTGRNAWWALIPAGVLAGLGATLIPTQIAWFNLVLTVGGGLGLGLLMWGTVSKTFGLIIPGCLMLGASAGTYLGWYNDPLALSPLTSTGTTLVVLALSWVLISVFSRAVTTGFVWWPLVPAGILAIVGYGLYIGGDPGSAANFIGNTGSVGLILMGIYLLMMRRDSQR